VTRVPELADEIERARVEAGSSTEVLPANLREQRERTQDGDRPTVACCKALATGILAQAPHVCAGRARR
jgi:hypothetical protein